MGVGMCRSVVAGYYFDAAAGACREFQVQCEADRPFFVTLEECQAACGPDPCALEPDTGPCDGAFARYYLDPASGRCKSFSWGGCAGVVPFEQAGECVLACTEPSPCGGFAGTPCSLAEETCADDPRDDCRPDPGSGDCPGICVPA
jgi:hypothetical protein